MIGDFVSYRQQPTGHREQRVIVVVPGRQLLFADAFAAKDDLSVCESHEALINLDSDAKDHRNVLTLPLVLPTIRFQNLP